MWVYNNSGPWNWLIFKVCIAVNCIRRLAMTGNFQEIDGQCSIITWRISRIPKLCKAYQPFSSSLEPWKLSLFHTCLTKTDQLSLPTTRCNRREITTKMRWQKDLPRSQKSFFNAPLPYEAPHHNNWLTWPRSPNWEQLECRNQVLFISAHSTWHSIIQTQINGGKEGQREGRKGS